MTRPYGGHPSRQGVPRRRPMPPRGNSKRNTWIVLAVAALTLSCCCSGFFRDSDKAASPQSRSATVTSRAPDPRDAAMFTATVVSVSGERIRVSSGNREQVLSLANVGSTSLCSNELHEPYRTRLAAVLPVASTVTVVRAKPGASYSNEVFLHVAASADTTVPPSGPSINEQLVAEGSTVLNGVLRDSTTKTFDDQVAAIRAQSQPVAVPYIDAIAKADTTAWDNRVGAIGQCRTRLDQEAEEKRQKWGPDGRAGTDDDPKRDYPSSPSIGNGNGNGNGNGSGGGGGGGVCRRSRWC